MRWCDLKMVNELWEYRPHSHKNQWREENSPIHKRVICLGSRCQEILKPFLQKTSGEYLFSPRDALEEHLAKRRALRKTKPTPSEGKRIRKQTPKRPPRQRYDVNNFQQAVRRACRRAKVPNWTVLQIRHARATDVRARYGVEGAQASLGNARVETAQIYAERNQMLAERIAREIG
jgi:integrase